MVLSLSPHLSVTLSPLKTDLCNVTSEREVTWKFFLLAWLSTLTF